MTGPDDRPAVEVALLCNLPVGVLAWRGPEPTLTVIVKATFSLREEGRAQLAAAQEPLTLDQPSPFGEPGDLDRPSDFVPYKASADLLLAGNAFAAAPAQVIPVAFSVDGLHKRFYALSSEPSLWAPLLPAYLRSAPVSDSEAVRVGARAIPADGGLLGDEGLPTGPLPRGFDYGVFNVAPDDQRPRILSSAAQIVLEGLLPGGLRRAVKLPGLRPRAFAFPARGASQRATPQEIALRCDTLWIDAGLERCTLTWRGLHVSEAGAAPLLVVGLDGRDEPFSLAEARRRLDDAVISRALTPADLRAQPPPPSMAEPGAGKVTLRMSSSPVAAVVPSGNSVADPSTEPFGDRDTGLDATGAIDTEALRRALDAVLPFPPEPAPAPRVGLFALGGSRLAETQLAALPEPPPPPAAPAFRIPPKASRTLPFFESTVEPAPVLPFTPSPSVPAPPQPVTPSPLQPSFGLPFAPVGATPASVPPPAPSVPPPAPSSPLLPAQPLMRLGPPPAASPWAPGSAAPAPRPLAPPLDPAPTPAPAPAPAANELPPTPLLPIEAYAEVKASIWGDGLALALVLERHGIDQDVWYENERRLARALAAEAKEGRQSLALTLREALRKARDRPPPDGDRPLGSIDGFLSILAAVEAAPDPVALLAARGITVAEWHRMSLRIHAKAEGDPALRARVGKKLGALRKALGPAAASPALKPTIRRERPPAAAKRVRVKRA